MRRAGALVAALVALALLCAGGGAAAPERARAAVFTGYGFDACTAPSIEALTAWAASPYRAVGIYIGGVNRACPDGNLSAAWVSTALSLGWSLMPLYVALQAPCVSDARLARISMVAATAAGQGRAAADDAAARAGVFGLPSGSPLYYDMEGYNVNDTACTSSVQAFVNAWVSEVRARGFVPGVYGSAASTIRDVSTLAATTPDVIWIADWNGLQSVFGDPYVSDALWPNHQRIHQYTGGHRETYGGVTINVDSSVVDGAVVGGGVPPPPPPPPGTFPAGSVASGDGKATASWPVGAFTETVAVTLTPTTSAAFPAAVYALDLDVARADASVVARFAAPITIHVSPLGEGLVALFSADGTTARTLPRLQSPALPAGLDAGYLTEADGSVDILTLVPGFFGLAADTTPPAGPDAVSGRLARSALTLSWPSAADASGVASYDLLRNGEPVRALPGGSRRTVVRAFDAAAPTVYRVRAVDLAGNAGRPSRPVVVLPTRRPAGIPNALPRWAWALFTWQHHGGRRPAAAPKRPPAWYWHWAAWRLQPFHLR